MNARNATRTSELHRLPWVLASLLLLLVASGLPSSAHAYAWRTCGDGTLVWNGRRANMYVSTTSFPAGSIWDALLQNAMYNWNDVRGAGFNFYVGRDTDGKHSSSNGRNEVYLAGSSEIGSALAVTRSQSHCYWLFGWKHGIDEADIGFNGDYRWSTSSYSYTNPTDAPYSFEGVALHELGHSLGLLHEDRWMATMNSIYPNCGPLGQSRQWDPLGDDRTGIRYLYRDSSGETDIAASTHKRTGSGTSDVTDSTSIATRGGYATFEYTFTNLGTSRKTFDIGFYLSSDNVITAYDLLLGSNSGAYADRGATGTFSRTLYIPTSVAPGSYYLGVIVDHDGSIAEANESNNAQVAPRRITIQ